jgi:hypothetical protein
MLEWPHVSTEDETQLAYTRDESKGQADVQTRTSIGKYLSRHWPHVPDHVRRDWAGTFHPSEYEMRDTIEGLISGVELGPQSCMKSSFGGIPFDSADNEQLCYWQKDHSAEVPWHKHPYSVYDPKLGWRMAVRIDTCRPAIVMGRAVVFVDTDDSKVFVRSYRRNSAGDHRNSGSDEKLETWLRDRGVCKRTCWPDGTPVKHMEHPAGGLMMPYLDGCTQTVELRDGRVYIDSDGGIQCDNTDGTTSDNSSMGDCENCGDTIFEGDEYLHAGRDADVPICSSCMEDYRCVEGAGATNRTIDYYVHEDNAVEASDVWYDLYNLPAFIVQLYSGAYVHIDDAVYIESRDEYYLREDNAVCYTTDGDWEMRDDCVECADDEWRPKDACVECADDEWRPKDDCVEIDGAWYGEGTEPESEPEPEPEPESVQMALE